MINKKIKRFLVKFRNNWKQIYSDDAFNKEDCKRMAKYIAEDIMTLDIEFRLKTLRKIQQIVIFKTESEVDDFVDKKNKHLENLREYNS